MPQKALITSQFAARVAKMLRKNEWMVDAGGVAVAEVVVDLEVIVAAVVDLVELVSVIHSKMDLVIVETLADSRTKVVVAAVAEEVAEEVAGVVAVTVVEIAQGGLVSATHFRRVIAIAEAAADFPTPKCYILYNTFCYLLMVTLCFCCSYQMSEKSVISIFSYVMIC